MTCLGQHRATLPRSLAHPPVPEVIERTPQPKIIVFSRRKEKKLVSITPSLWTQVINKELVFLFRRELKRLSTETLSRVPMPTRSNPSQFAACLCPCEHCVQCKSTSVVHLLHAKHCARCYWKDTLPPLTAAGPVLNTSTVSVWFNTFKIKIAIKMVLCSWHP